MDSTAGPGLRGQKALRTIFRAVGLVAAPVGVLMVVVGFTRFAGGSQDDDFLNGGAASGAPDGFFMFGAGGLIVVLGIALLSAGFMGASARYGAGETMPVVKDSATYLSGGRGILGVGQVAGATQQAVVAEGPYCSGCGVRNDATASLCDACGKQLA